MIDLERILYPLNNRNWAEEDVINVLELTGMFLCVVNHMSTDQHQTDNFSRVH